MTRLRFLTRNIGWKLLSLAGALVIWAGVARDPELVSFVTVPVQYQHTPGDLEINSDVIEHAYLELQGTSSLLDRFRQSRPAVTLDFSHVDNPGERTFDIDEDSVNLPHGLKLIRAIPSQLRFDFDKQVGRDVKVEVRFSGKPQPGYHLAHYDVTPSTLKVLGPESRVKHIETARTDPVDLSTVVASSEFRVNTFVDDPHVRFQGSPRVVVKVVVEKD